MATINEFLTSAADAQTKVEDAATAVATAAGQAAELKEALEAMGFDGSHAQMTTATSHLTDAQRDLAAIAEQLSAAVECGQASK